LLSAARQLLCSLVRRKDAVNERLSALDAAAAAAAAASVRGIADHYDEMGPASHTRTAHFQRCVVVLMV